MKNLNNYINEAWSGMKQHTLKSDIEAWCEKMGIEDYTINDKGEIDVNGNVDLRCNDFKELSYKFGKVTGYFDIGENKKLTSLKNCPNFVGDYFSCSFCPQLDSPKGCPKEVGRSFYCNDCKKNFTEKEVKTLCKVIGKIIV